ncbi:hypothetical protein, partial [Petrachloros mirabilis]
MELLLPTVKRLSQWKDWKKVIAVADVMPIWRALDKPHLRCRNCQEMGSRCTCLQLFFGAMLKWRMLRNLNPRSWSHGFNTLYDVMRSSLASRSPLMLEKTNYPVFAEGMF